MNGHAPEPGDFLALKTRFEKSLTNGQRAEIRRAADPEALRLLPAFYYALPGEGARDDRWLSIVFMLPHAKQWDGAEPLGHQLAEAGVSEMRLFQMVRSGFPQDLLHLRRLCLHIDAKADWRRFGRMLYYWSEKEKLSIVEDYFLGLTRSRKTMLARTEEQDG